MSSHFTTTSSHSHQKDLFYCIQQNENVSREREGGISWIFTKLYHMHNAFIQPEELKITPFTDTEKEYSSNHIQNNHLT